ncbi:hypothetical protein [Ferrovibrio sp.]|jgi:hypothetical protein|uniref:hypothetical protein n=1 Tax=Ferrovibrio sp. TaxID=1917215 RepID=UPI0035B21FEF
MIRKLGYAAIPFFTLALGLAAISPAQAGMVQVEPGAASQIDVGDRSNYTTITISNAGAVAGRLELGAPVNQTIEVPAGGKVELYGAYGRGPVSGSYVSLKNSGNVPLHVLSRYQETVRLP